MSDKTSREIIAKKFKEFKIFDIGNEIGQIAKLDDEISVVNNNYQKHFATIFKSYIKQNCVEFAANVNEEKKEEILQWITDRFDFNDQDIEQNISEYTKKIKNITVEMRTLYTTLSSYSMWKNQDLNDDQILFLLEKFERLSIISQDLQETVENLSVTNNNVYHLLKEQIYEKLTESGYEDKFGSFLDSYDIPRNIIDSLDDKKIEFTGSKTVITQANTALIKLAGVMTTQKIDQLMGLNKFDGISIGMQDFSSISLNHIFNLENTSSKKMIVWSQKANLQSTTFPQLKIQKMFDQGQFSYKAIYDDNNQIIVEPVQEPFIKAYNGQEAIVTIKPRNGGREVFGLAGGGNTDYLADGMPQALTLFMVNVDEKWKSIVAYNKNTNTDTHITISSIPTYQLDYAERTFTSLVRNIIDLEIGKDYIFTLTPNKAIYFPVLDTNSESENKSFLRTLQSPTDLIKITFDQTKIYNNETEAVYLRVKEAIPNGKDYIAAAFIMPGEKFPGK